MSKEKKETKKKLIKSNKKKVTIKILKKLTLINKKQ